MREASGSEGSLKNGSEGSLKISLKKTLILRSGGVPEGLKSVPRGLLNPSWSLFSSWMPLELFLEASCSALGGLRGRKKVLLNGSGPVQDDFQDRFQPSWGPKGSRKGGQEGPKSSPRGDSSPKRDFFKNNVFEYILMMLMSRGRFLEVKID